MNALNAAADSLLNLLFPPRCLTCETLDTADCLCAQCIDRIEPVDVPACPVCGLTMSLGAEQVHLDTQSPSDRRRRGWSATAHLVDPSIPSSHFCPHCSERTPAFDKAGSLGDYRGVLRDAIHHLKYRDKPQLGRPLGALLAEYARTNASQFHNLKFDAVIAIPMHPSRRKQRGYNQAERVAASFANDIGLTLETGAVLRSKKTISQVGLTARERIANISDAFTVPIPERTAGKTCIIIDDVTTTGSTLHECAKALKAVGAEAVYALTLAAD